MEGGDLARWLRGGQILMFGILSSGAEVDGEGYTVSGLDMLSSQVPQRFPLEACTFVDIFGELEVENPWTLLAFQIE